MRSSNAPFSYHQNVNQPFSWTPEPGKGPSPMFGWLSAMANFVQNPILNSACDAPTRYRKFDDDRSADKVQDRWRPSAYLMPIPPAQRRAL